MDACCARSTDVENRVVDGEAVLLKMLEGAAPPRAEAEAYPRNVQRPPSSPFSAIRADGPVETVLAGIAKPGIASCIERAGARD
ncbi:MAG: hypothetical protein ACYTKD_20150 [Planctomycetota bacterium]|jgi:hypothetical protein